MLILNLDPSLMTVRTKKLIGVFAFLIYLTVYCLLVMGIAANYILPLGGIVQGVFFVVAGFLWLPPAMMLIRWMHHPEPE